MRIRLRDVISNVALSNSKMDEGDAYLHGGDNDNDIIVCAAFECRTLASKNYGIFVILCYVDRV